MTVVLVAPAPALADIAAEWLDLWTRCRIAIETVTPLDTDGLVDLGIGVVEEPETEPPTRIELDDAEFVVPLLPLPQPRRVLAERHGTFVLVEQEYVMASGVRRTCDVRLRDRPLTDTEEGILARAFLVERSRLIAGRTHETRDPDPGFPLVSLGVGPVEENGNGCSVISTIVFEPDGQFFTSGSGEQSAQGCRGSSLFDEGRE